MAGGFFVQFMPWPTGLAAAQEAAQDSAQEEMAGRLETTVGGPRSVSRLIEEGLRPEDSPPEKGPNSPATSATRPTASCLKLPSPEARSIALGAPSRYRWQQWLS